MEVKLSFVMRKIANEYVLVPVGTTPLTVNGLITTNEVGAFLWENLQNAADEAALVELLLETYDVQREQAEADVAEFLQTLRDAKIL